MIENASNFSHRTEREREQSEYTARRECEKKLELSSSLSRRNSPEVLCLREILCVKEVYNGKFIDVVGSTETIKSKLSSIVRVQRDPES